MAKKNDEAPDYVGRHVANASSDKLDKLKAKAREAMTLEYRMAHGNELLAKLKHEHAQLVTRELPDMMDELEIPSITVEGEGNEPPFTIKNDDFYSAGIAASWDEDKKEQGYKYLEKIGHGDLIKQEVSFFFPSGTEPALIYLFIEAAMKLKVAITPTRRGKKQPVIKLEIPQPSVKRSVSGQTLTAQLKRWVEQDKFIPGIKDLEKIGGYIGKKVKLKTVKEQ